jgi:hypothetical protein
MRRNRYFTGKFMNALDFTTEQTYFVRRHWLHNRLLHGWGIACGLDVTKPTDAIPEHCKNRVVIVHPGVALDCCGREIIVADKKWYELPLDGPDAVELPFLLCLRYAETCEQPVPALDDSGGCAEHLEDTYYREGFKLEAHRRDEQGIDVSCWPIPNDPDSRREPSSTEAGCLKPSCPCGALVPLALLDQDDDGTLIIDLGGRRPLPLTPVMLTHISRFNWTHGGRKELHEFRHEHHGHEQHRLIVHFDRPLWQYDGEERHALGISEHTFRVEFRRHDGTGGVVPPHPHHRPHYDPNHRAAVFVIDPHFLDRVDGEITVYVTLCCDFILDEHGRAVDGDHLRGTVPTGNGIAGGTFESWFRLRRS